MTDSEVKSSPTTEAGRDLMERVHGKGDLPEWAYNDDLAAIAAIEQQAREGGYSSGLLEGRREAVRRIEAEIRRDAEDFTGYGAEWMRQRILNYRIPAAVAGLEGEGRSPIGSNASESPPTACDFLTYRDGTVDCLTHRWLHGAKKPDSGVCPNASESPPTAHRCTEDCLADCPWCGAEVDHRDFHLVGCVLGDILAGLNASESSPTHRGTRPRPSGYRRKEPARGAPDQSLTPQAARTMSLRVRLTPDEFAGLRAQALATGRSVSQVARTALVPGDASESPPLCDQIVNNGFGEPTECGRTLPCPFHRWPFGDASESGQLPQHRPAIGLSSAGRHTLCMDCGEPWPCRGSGQPPEVSGNRPDLLCPDCGHHLHRPKPGPCQWRDCSCGAER